MSVSSRGRRKAGVSGSMRKIAKGDGGQEQGELWALAARVISSNERVEAAPVGRRT